MAERRRFYRPQSDEDEKRCHGCGESKPVEEFVRDASKRGGLASLCRVCDRERSKRYYSENREAVLARAAEIPSVAETGAIAGCTPPNTRDASGGR